MIKSQSAKDAAAVLAAATSRRNVSAERGIEPPTDYDKLTAQYRSWVYICTRLNATSVASTPLRLFATSATGETRSRRPARKVSNARQRELREIKYLAESPHIKLAEEIEEICEHPFLRLMQDVNPEFSFYDLLEATQTGLELTGDNYWLIDTDALNLPSDICPLPPQLMRIVPGTDRLVKGYLFGRNVNNRIAFEAEQIVHFKFYNPNNIFYGWSPLEAAAAGVSLNNSMTEFEGSLFDNRGQPGMVIQYTDKELLKPQQIELEIEWNNKLRSQRKSGKSIVIDKSVTLTDFGLKPKEMSYPNGRRWTRLEIADAYGVPLALLDTENVNKANASEALHQYNKFSVTPRLHKIAQKINSRLIKMFNEPRLFVAFDNVVPADMELELKREDQDIKNSVRSINEVRGVRGLEPASWGEVPLSVSAQPPADPAIELSAKKPEHCTCRPEKGANTKQEHDVLLTGGANPKLSPNEQGIADALQETWAAQRAAILPKVRLKGTDFDQLAHPEWAATTAAAAEPFMLDTATRGGRAALREVAGELDKPLATALESFVNSNDLHAFVEKETFRFASRANDVIVSDLKASFIEGTQAGDSLLAMRDRIKSTFDIKGYLLPDGTRASKHVKSWKSTMIARTEAKRSTTTGKDVAWRNEGFTTKEWKASNDACPFCMDMDGKQESMGGNFWNEGEFQDVTSDAFGADDDGNPKSRAMKHDFSDVIGPPLHINCRCEILPVFQ